MFLRLSNLFEIGHHFHTYVTEILQNCEEETLRSICKFLDRDTIYIVSIFYTTTMDLKKKNQDVPGQQNFNFNLRVFSKILFEYLFIMYELHPFCIQLPQF